MKCDKLKCEKTKTVMIGILAVLCVFLAIMLFFKNDSASSASMEPAAITSAPVISAISGTDKKLSPSAVIHMATIEGISLDTKPEEIEKIAKSSGFGCEKSGDESQTTWSCKHSKLDETALKIVLTNGKISEVSRNGEIVLGNLVPTLNMIEDLKFRLDTRKNVRFSQSEDAFSLSIRTTDQSIQEELDYNIMNRRIRDTEKKTMKMKQIYTAKILAR